MKQILFLNIEIKNQIIDLEAIETVIIKVFIFIFMNKLTNYFINIRTKIRNYLEKLEKQNSKNLYCRIVGQC